MRYDVTELTVTPGAEVKIIFENADDMPHNIVFFQPGTDVVEVCNKQMEKPEEALKRNWLPEDPRMWLHSKDAQPEGEGGDRSSRRRKSRASIRTSAPFPATR